MKFLAYSCVFLTLAAGIVAFKPAEEILPLEIGADIPLASQEMKDVISDQAMSINSIKGEAGTLVMFSCNTCPYVVASESRIEGILAQAQKLRIGTIVINSNEAKRTSDDAYEAMKTYGKEHKYYEYNTPYVIDARSAVADAFGATRTPECYLFNSKGQLVYRGAIDDSPKDASAVKETYLSNAMQELLAGKEITVKTSKSIGCSIKRMQ